MAQLLINNALLGIVRHKWNENHGRSSLLCAEIMVGTYSMVGCMAIRDTYTLCCCCTSRKNTYISNCLPRNEEEKMKWLLAWNIYIECTAGDLIMYSVEKQSFFLVFCFLPRRSRLDRGSRSPCSRLASSLCFAPSTYLLYYYVPTCAKDRCIGQWSVGQSVSPSLQETVRALPKTGNCQEIRYKQPVRIPFFAGTCYLQTNKLPIAFQRKDVWGKYRRREDGCRLLLSLSAKQESQLMQDR